MTFGASTALILITLSCTARNKPASSLVLYFFILIHNIKFIFSFHNLALFSFYSLITSASVMAGDVGDIDLVWSLAL